MGNVIAALADEVSAFDNLTWPTFDALLAHSKLLILRWFSHFLRPSSTTSPYGAVTSYTYNDTASPPSKSASTNGHSVNTIMDGFGRTIQTTSGASTTLSIVDTQYAPCGCSPLGKLSQQSQPYAPGGSDAWTVYHYDASGRTTSTVLPDGSTTTYLYTGNIVKVTDAASHWKQFSMDALGNLVTVTESDPTLGNVTTNYTYDVLNHLTGVSMPRGTTTQTRTFNYTSGHTVGALLLSATNPENGTVTYTYGANYLLASKTDAKGQQLTYQYDTYNRLTSVTWANAPNAAIVLRTYYYDTNPLDSTGFSQNTLGRLTAVQYVPLPMSTVPSTPGPVSLVDMYSYIGPTSSGAGLPAAKRLQVKETVGWIGGQGVEQYYTGSQNLDSTYTYNNEGKVTAMTYPTTTPSYTTGNPNNVTGASYNYSYDSMYRLSGMTTSGSTTVVSGVSYNAANQLLGMTFNGVAETRGYNVLNQLTNVHDGSAVNLTYNYPTGTNNGKVSSMYNAISGETVTYTYDSLNRIATAGGSGWGEAYTFDPFGNLYEKTVTSGSGPSMLLTVNSGNNQVAGSYDANGNATSNTGNALVYDVENHVSGAGWSNGAPAIDYAYDAQSKRFLLYAGTKDSSGNPSGYSVVAYSPSGQKLGIYQIFTCNNSTSNQTALTICDSLTTSDQYFGGRRLASMDQLGSVGTFYPWGEAKGTTNPQDTWSYATYWRDSVTGLDYANNRYYNNAYGRFMTPDPYQASGGPADPQSWNRYAYTVGDPVNRLDPTGLDYVVTCGGSEESDSDINCAYISFNQGGCMAINGMVDPVCGNYAFQGKPGGASGPSAGTAHSPGSNVGPPGYSGALALLKNASTDCLKDINASSATAAANTLVGSTINYTWGLTPQTGATGLVVNGAAAAESISSQSGNVININLNYGWFNPASVTYIAPSGNSYQGNYLAAVGDYVGNPGLTIAQYQELILIHEIGHLDGVPQETSNAYDTAIFKDCIKGH